MPAYEPQVGQTYRLRFTSSVILEDNLGMETWKTEDLLVIERIDGTGGAILRNSRTGNSASYRWMSLDNFERVDAPAPPAPAPAPAPPAPPEVFYRLRQDQEVWLARPAVGNRREDWLMTDLLTVIPGDGVGESALLQNHRTGTAAWFYLSLLERVEPAPTAAPPAAEPPAPLATPDVVYRLRQAQEVRIVSPAPDVSHSEPWRSDDLLTVVPNPRSGTFVRNGRTGNVARFGNRALLERVSPPSTISITAAERLSLDFARAWSGVLEAEAPPPTAPQAPLIADSISEILERRTQSQIAEAFSSILTPYSSSESARAFYTLVRSSAPGPAISFAVGQYLRIRTMGSVNLTTGAIDTWTPEHVLRVDEIVINAQQMLVHNQTHGTRALFLLDSTRRFDVVEAPATAGAPEPGTPFFEDIDSAPPPSPVTSLFSVGQYLRIRSEGSVYGQGGIREMWRPEDILCVESIDVAAVPRMVIDNRTRGTRALFNCDTTRFDSAEAPTTPGPRVPSTPGFIPLFRTTEFVPITFRAGQTLRLREGQEPLAVPRRDGGVTTITREHSLYVERTESQRALFRIGEAAFGTVWVSRSHQHAFEVVPAAGEVLSCEATPATPARAATVADLLASLAPMRDLADDAHAALADLRDRADLRDGSHLRDGYDTDDAETAYHALNELRDRIDSLLEAR